MTKAELLNAIKAERARLEALLNGLTPEQMTQPGAMGEWSIKDLLGHIAMWEARLVTNLFAIGQGVKPGVASPNEVDRLNAQSLAEQRQRPLDRVLADFHAVHRQLLKRLEMVTERDLTDPKRFKWLEGEPLERMVAGNTFEHYAGHCPAIEAWRTASGL